MKLLVVRDAKDPVIYTVNDRDEVFLVNLTDHNLNGSCTCAAFSSCIHRLESGTTRRIRCRHIVAAREYALDHSLREHRKALERRAGLVEPVPPKEKSH